MLFLRAKIVQGTSWMSGISKRQWILSWPSLLTHDVLITLVFLLSFLLLSFVPFFFHIYVMNLSPVCITTFHSLSNSFFMFLSLAFNCPPEFQRDERTHVPFRIRSALVVILCRHKTCPFCISMAEDCEMFWYLMDSTGWKMEKLMPFLSELLLPEASFPAHDIMLAFHNICLWLQGPDWVLPHSCFEWVTWRGKSLVPQAGVWSACSSAVLSRSHEGYFQWGEKETQVLIFLPACSTLITLGEKQLCSPLCLISVVFCCCLLFHFFQLE